MLAHFALLLPVLLTGSQDPLSPKALVDSVARKKTRDSLEQLKEFIDSSDNDLREAAVDAMWVFHDDPVLSRKAIEFLFQRTSARDEQVRWDVIFGLMKFGADAYDELEQVVRKNKNPRIRAYALQALLPRLTHSGKAEDLELVIDNCMLGRTKWRWHLVEIIAGFDLELSLPVFERRLKAGKLLPEVETVILETLIERDGEGVDRVLQLGLRDKTPMVQHVALRAVRDRDLEPFAASIERLTKSPDRSVRVAAFIALLHGGPDDGVVADPFTAALHKDPVVRWVSIEPLTEIATGVAVDRLNGLATDEDRTVRARARDALVELHRPESIPVLIGVAEAESGVGLRRTIEALRLLTGVDHGRLAARWAAWWQDTKAGFEMPTKEVAHAAEAQREVKRVENLTQATFYQLPIESHRVCFLIDLSGSMTWAAADGRPRIDVALEELEAAILALPEGSRCNVILFAERSHRWKRLAQVMDDRSRAQAIAFAGRPEPNGGTDLYEGLELAFEDPGMDTIYLLTDGEPSEGLTYVTNQLRLEVGRWNETQRAIIHTISVGEDSDLLQKLAADTGGTYKRAD